MPGFGQDYNLKALCRYANASTHWPPPEPVQTDGPMFRFGAFANCRSSQRTMRGSSQVATLNRIQGAFGMRSKDDARREHGAFAPSGFRERERARDVW